MRFPKPAALLLLSIGLTGCGRTPKVDNPVLGPPPPRVSYDDSGSKASDLDGVAFVNDQLDPRVEGTAPGEYVQVSLTKPENEVLPPGGLAQSNVVARVNGKPIFEGDVLEPYAKFFEQNGDKMSGRELAEAKRTILKRSLEPHIERELLTQALQQNLKSEQFNQMKGRLRDYFDEYVEDMMQKVGVTTKYELALKLEEEGQTLDSLERAFVNQQLALVYVSQNTQKEIRIGRADLVAYYEENLDDYLVEEQVKWQRLQIEFDEHGGKAKAFERLEQAVGELKQGADFADVCRKWSDGPRAEKGGYWDWTRRGNLKNEEVERALFKLQVGVPSRIFVDDESYQIVRVLERRERGHVRFEEVQEEIRAAVERRFKDRQSKEIIAELRERAEITTVLDDEPLVDDVHLPFQ